MIPTYRPRGFVQWLLHMVGLGAAAALHLAGELLGPRYRERRCRCDRCVARRLPRDGQS